jgi:putative ABC transport system ATP-binding protein
MREAIFQLDNIHYSYVDGGRKRVILRGLSYDFLPGRFYTILGPSGSGKSTLLAIASALDQPELGSIKFRGEDIKKMGYTRFRRHNIAIVFQKYNLMDYLTGVENVESDMMIAARKLPGKRREIAYKILDTVGIVKTKADRLVTTLSGGEQQRVAIARALAKDVDLILGDEPTGALDTETEREVISLLKSLAYEYGKTIIIATHSDDVAGQSDTVLRLKDGQLFPVAGNRGAIG